MFIEPTITWVPSGSLGTYGSTQKLCSKKKKDCLALSLSASMHSHMYSRSRAETLQADYPGQVVEGLTILWVLLRGWAYGF